MTRLDDDQQPRIDCQARLKVADEHQLFNTQYVGKSVLQYIATFYVLTYQVPRGEGLARKPKSLSLIILYKAEIANWQGSQNLRSQHENKGKISRYFRTFYASLLAS